MMTRETFIKEYGKALKGAYLIDFGIKEQFPIFEFLNESENCKIQFFIDCKISSNDSDLNEIANQLKKYDSDTYEICYSIAANRKLVLDVVIAKNGDLILKFDNNFDLYFKIVNDSSEPLNVSITEKDRVIKGCRFYNDGTIDGK